MTNSLTPAGCPAIQFISGTVYLELASDDPTKLPPLLMPTASSRLSPVLLTEWLWVALPWPPLGFSDLLEWLTKLQGNTHISLAVYYKEYNGRWIAKWRDTKDKFWKHRNFCPCGVGVYHPPGTWCVHQLGSFLKPIFLEFLWGLHHINSISSPSPLSKLLIMVWTFW